MKWLWILRDFGGKGCFWFWWVWIRNFSFSVNFFFERFGGWDFVFKNLEKYYRVRGSNIFFEEFKNFKCVCFFSYYVIDLFFIEI